MNIRTAVFSALAATVAAPALAGSLTPPPPEPVVAPAVPYTPAGPNWTGFYAGAELGWANIDTNVAGVDGDDVIGGITLGYDYDFGTWVLGGGLDYDWADINISSAPATSVDNIFRAKLRAGYKVGNGLAYLTGGYAMMDITSGGVSIDDDGYFVGAGYDHMITDNFALGGEVLYHNFDNFNGTTTDVEAVTVQVRGTFRF